MAKKGARVIIHLECTSCRKNDGPGVSRYTTEKNKRTSNKKLSLKKYCPFERKHTVHKEKR